MPQTSLPVGESTFLGEFFLRFFDVVSYHATGESTFGSKGVGVPPPKKSQKLMPQLVFVKISIANLGASTFFVEKKLMPQSSLPVGESTFFGKPFKMIFSFGVLSGYRGINFWGEGG